MLLWLAVAFFDTTKVFTGTIKIKLSKTPLKKMINTLYCI